MSSHVEPVKGIEPPKATVPVMYPYIPPEIDDVSYHPKAPQCSNSSNIPPEVKEVPVITRIYSDLESHYAEEPISVYNLDYKPADKILEVPQVVKTWAAANEMKKEVKNSVVESVSESDCVQEIAVEDTNDPKVSLGHEEASVSAEKEQSENCGSNDKTSSSESWESNKDEVSVLVLSAWHSVSAGAP